MKLDFSNAVFNDEINVTVRRGDKWGVANPDDVFHITDHGKSTGTAALIRAVIRTRFDSLTDDDLEAEHDPACRTTEGLLKVMGRVYPEFQEDEDVTLLVFTVLQ